VRNVNDRHRPLIVILIALASSVLVTGGLAVYLTLARQGGGEADVVVQVTSELPVASVAPGEPRIAFTSDREGDVAIYVMHADGLHQQRVSEPGRGFCIYPSWSPDGQRVAYIEVQEEPTEEAHTGAEIWISAADGTEHIRVSHAISHVLSIQPTWSPDGTRLAFVAATGSAEADDFTSVIHIAGTDGSIVRSLPLPWMIYHLAWSPTGDEWLLISETSDGERVVHTLSGDGNEISEVFRGALAAAWSPDGAEIAVGDQASREVIVLGRDQEPRSAIQLSSNAGVGMQPVEIAWSPDGARIAVAAARNPRQGYADALYIATLETDEIVAVVKDEGWVAQPNWSPDGSHLLFTMGPLRQRPGVDLPYGNLWVYDVIPGELRQLTLSAGFDGVGAWSP
jgi:Tol biopolymer transport system component